MIRLFLLLRLDTFQPSRTTATQHHGAAMIHHRRGMGAEFQLEEFCQSISPPERPIRFNNVSMGYVKSNLKHPHHPVHRVCHEPMLASSLLPVRFKHRPLFTSSSCSVYICPSLTPPLLGGLGRVGWVGLEGKGCWLGWGGGGGETGPGGVTA